MRLRKAMGNGRIQDTVTRTVCPVDLIAPQGLQYQLVER